jgi:hypothetical protein
MKPNTVRTSVDIPRDLHLRLKKVAAERGCSARQLILRGVENAVAEKPVRKAARRLDLRNNPIIKGTGKTLEIDNAKINELLADLY